MAKTCTNRVPVQAPTGGGKFQNASLPDGAVPVARSYTVHRVAKRSEVTGSSDEGIPSTIKGHATGSSPSTSLREDFDEKLAVGDRVIIRYIDDERSRPESYILSNKSNDPKNGVLLLSSPLGKRYRRPRPAMN